MSVGFQSFLHLKVQLSAVLGPFLFMLNEHWVNIFPSSPVFRGKGVKGKERPTKEK